MSKTIQDPYAELGVKATATDAEIKKAFRALAKKLHPDINVGDAASQDRFKAISAAYTFLTDKEKKRRFDAGEIDASGAEKPDRSFYKDFSSKGPRHRYEPEGNFDGFGDIFSRAFGGDPRYGARQGANMPMRGGDLRFHLTISFRDAITGAKQQLTPPNGSKLEVSIPAGIKEGQTLRLAGRGQPGINGGPAGDALIEISVAPDVIFTRDGDDILLDLPISIDEAVLGASVEVPTVKGRVKLRIPAGSSSGRVMRIKERGAPSGKGKIGDQLVTLKIVLPDEISESLVSAMEDLRTSGGYGARDGWKGETK
ncbi:DnaJ C-terminal domain-containing protein [Falsihalocynthiibacter sp. S25ZX9]|uniref:DnaJ C-terminal domain-containing protein n=1 Tax=Falsihalocynthiibacter sp. S25ZX9 TaxID=3240870 RepID=UPI00351018E4